MVKQTIIRTRILINIMDADTNCIIEENFLNSGICEGPYTTNYEYSFINGGSEFQDLLISYREGEENLLPPLCPVSLDKAFVESLG